MNRELCFRIMEKELYLEKILVDYNEIPIFYLCTDDSEYYIVLCTDIDEGKYIVTKTCLQDVSGMLHGKLSMREIITKKKEYWDVVAGEEIDDDIVSKRKMSEIPVQDLPYEESYFKVASKDIEEYLEMIDGKLYNASDWVKIPNSKTYSGEINLDVVELPLEEVDIRFQRYIEIYNKVLQTQLKKNDYDIGFYTKESIEQECISRNINGIKELQNEIELLINSESIIALSDAA